jgi:hypothetical protein
MSATMNEETIVRLARRSLWTVMLLVILLLLAAALVVMAPDSEAAALGNRLFKVLPVLIVIGCGAMLGKVRHTPGSRALMRQVLNDELRQQSLARGYRNGFFAMLCCQAPLLLLFITAGAGSAAALLACTTAAIGLLTAIATVLWYDR